jgi:hypothetical protein
MVISHVTIVADSALCFHAILGATLYIKQNIRSLLSCWYMLINTQNKFHIFAHPRALYLISLLLPSLKCGNISLIWTKKIHIHI